MSILKDIQLAKKEGKKLLAILVDPDKVDDSTDLISNLKSNPPDYIFVGGSIVKKDDFNRVINELHVASICPVIIFPGDEEQISNSSNAILLLSLISGRNPEFLIDQHVRAAKKLKRYSGEIIPTSYILVNGGNVTSVQKVSQTTPIDPSDEELIVSTAIAGELLGHQLTYLEAGSGAFNTVPQRIVRNVVQNTEIPLIVGGGIKSVSQAEKIWNAGATLIVVGTAFENNPQILSDLGLKND